MIQKHSVSSFLGLALLLLAIASALYPRGSQRTYSRTATTWRIIIYVIFLIVKFYLLEHEYATEK